MLTVLLSWRRGLARSLTKRVGEEDWREGEGEEVAEGEGGAALIKSTNPLLAGGEKNKLEKQ